MGDPYFYGIGQNFILVVGTCQDKANIFGVSDEECADPSS